MQQGGSQSQYGAPPPDVPPFASGTGRSRADHVLGASAPEHLQQQQAQPVAEAASPISSRAPPRGNSLDELAGPGCFPDEDALAAAAGEEAERAVGPPGNRWPRQETLALLRIRSEMDAVFRDATLKAPLWEDVSRKLAELGYRRSAKKCKEKFENVHKYYKRTKDGRAGRQDGKSYRFFSQLEALHSSGGAAPTAAASPLTAPATSGSVPNTVTSSIGMVGSPSTKFQPTPLNAIPPSVATAPLAVPDPMAAASGPPGGISFSATSSSSASESEDDTEEGLTGQPRKRKRRGGGGVGRKMMAFFEGLMRQVVERQEAMQQRFLEAIEKREQDRMIREEAWKRQEVARLNREHEMMDQERKMSASRDAAIITFLQKMTGQTVPVPPLVPEAAPPQPHAPSQQHPPPAPASPPPPEQTRPQPQQTVPVVRSQALTLDIVPLSEVPEAVITGAGSSSMDPASSRWPKSEVHALIQVRSELDSRYQEAGPKGPLWEEVAARMQRLGYNRSSKRCKEKWENINKYFKKVKESNKKRPEDSKTCPYFHQLETIYRRKLLVGGAGSSSLSDRAEQQVLAVEPLPQPPPPPKAESTQGKCIDGGGGDNNDNGGGNPGGNGGPSSSAQKTQKTSNGALKHGIFDEGPGGGGSVKKPEDIVKELMDDQQQQRQHKTILISNYDKSEELDTDEDGDEDDDDGEMDYRIHNYLQRAGVNGTSNGAASAAAGSFMAMMQ